MKVGVAAVAVAVVSPLAWAQPAADSAAAVALAALRGQRAQCLQVKEAPARAKCLDGVVELALKLAEAAPAPAKSPVPSPVAAPKDRWAETVTEGLAYLTRAFKDPLTVKYRELALHGDGGSPTTLCGELNGRNSYGAYVGYKRFFVLLPALASEIDDPRTGVVAAAWPRFCGSKLADIEVSASGEVAVARVPMQSPSVSVDSQPASGAPKAEETADGCPAAAPGCSWGRKQAK